MCVCVCVCVLHVGSWGGSEPCSYPCSPVLGNCRSSFTESIPVRASHGVGSLTGRDQAPSTWLLGLFLSDLQFSAMQTNHACLPCTSPQLPNTYAQLRLLELSSRSGEQS